jgi:hypothetical protein
MASQAIADWQGALSQAPDKQLQRTVMDKVMAWTPLIGTAS